MELNFEKYTQKKSRGINSPITEQIDIATKILQRDFGMVAGLTKHMSLDDLYLINKESKNKPQFWWSLFNKKYKLNNMEKIILEKLETVPAFRERSKRDKFLTILTLRDIGVEVPKILPTNFTLTMNIDELSKFAVRYGTAQRIWRELLMKNTNLRGSDFEERAELENKFINNLRK